MARTSASLLEQLRVAPNEAAWVRFVEIYGPLVYHWLTRYGLQDHDARDVGQEVLLAVIKEMPKFQYDPVRGTFRGWLRGVMVNRLQGFWRERRTKAALETSGFQRHIEELRDSASSATERWNEEYESGVTARVLGLLKAEFEPNTWQAFWRVVVDGDKPASVAAALGISANAVYLAKSRVLRRLREDCDGLLE